MSAVLTGVDQATPDRLTEILQEHGVLSTGRVEEVEIRTTGAWNSRSYFLDLHYSDDAPGDAPRHLFLKMNTEPEWGKEEVVFYLSVNDKRVELPMLVPCYDAAYNETDGMSHLLLADLLTTHTEPVTRAQLLAGDTLPSQRHLNQMVDAIAGFHAYWWEHPRLGEGFARIRTQLDGKEAYRQYTERREREWSLLVEKAAHLISAEIRGIYEKVLSHFAALWDPYLADRFGPMKGVTLSQGDCYITQFLCPIRPEDDSTYLMDFDSVSANLPAYDLVYMFPTFWTPEQRNNSGLEKNLLRRYHNALLAHGVTGYTWPHLLQDYRLCILYMIFDPVWDQTSGAPESYWLPKMRCLTGAFKDLDCLALLPQ